MNSLRQPARLNLLILDELGLVPLSLTGGEPLFEVFTKRYERGSVMVTTNLPFDEWTEFFGSERLTGALLDRLTPTSTSSRLTAKATASSAAGKPPLPKPRTILRKSRAHRQRHLPSPLSRRYSE